MPAFPATSKQDTIAADGRHPALALKILRAAVVAPTPEGVTDLVVTVTSTTATFNFTPVATATTSYLFQVATGTTWGGDRYASAAAVAGGAYNYTGLTPGAPYLGRVFVNGVVSNTFAFTMQPAVGITNLSIETTSENSTYNFSLLSGTANYTFQLYSQGVWGSNIVVPASALSTGTYTRTTTANTPYQYRILTDGVASNVVAATTPAAQTPPPSTDLADYQLAAGHYVDQEYAMVAVLPRPDSETGSFLNDNVLARYRWAYYDGTNPVRYEVALKVFGGSAPHMYELRSGPPGMTVGNDRTPASHGVVKWTPTQAYSDVSPASVSVRVYGQDGNFIDLNWTIQTTSSTSKFMFADADSGNDTTGTGSISAPFKTLYKFTGVDSGTTTYPGRIVYLRGSTANYETVAHTNAWMPNAGDLIPARLSINYTRHPNAFIAFPDEAVSIDFSGAQILTGSGQNDFFIGGSSTADLRIIGSADNAAETHNLWLNPGHRGHLQWINFDGFVPRENSGYTNSAPIFTPNSGANTRNYWSAHALKETNRTVSSANDGMIWIIFRIHFWVDEYCSGHRTLPGSGRGPGFKDTCYNTSSRYLNVSTTNGSASFSFMGQGGSGNNEVCYSQIKGAMWFNLQAGPNVGKMVEYRNTIVSTDTNYPQCVRAWKGTNWTGPYLSKNSVLQSNGPAIVNSAVTVTGSECHSTNSGGNQSINTTTMTVQNKTGGTQYRDLYLYTRGHEIG